MALRIGPLSRRALIRAAAAGAVTAVANATRGKLSYAQRTRAYPFTLGVASGDPALDGFVLWTRLAPAPLEGGGMPPEDVPISWEIAEDPRFFSVLQRGTSIAMHDRAHAVHVDIRGLAPDRWYFYRFVALGEVSPVGRARTFPRLGTPAGRLRFAAASCQHYSQGFFTPYRAMMEDDLDLIVHLGDYIYESASALRVREQLPEPVTLEQYRNHHALYRTDRDLQAVHARHPFAVTWDDHEVDSDYAGDQSEDGEPAESFLERRTAAYRAYFEHMPLRAAARPQGAAMQLYRSLVFGDLATLLMLDNRQYRSDQACPNGKGGGQIIESCAERTKEDRTMLGAAQERWLAGRLIDSRSRWNILGQQMLMAQLRQKPGASDAWWSDGWDGYPAARRRLLSLIAEREIDNVVVLGGDIHSFWVTDLKSDFDDPKSRTLATEFVGTSVTSQGGPYERFASVLPDNPHVRFFESRQRGYLRCEVRPDLWRTDLRVVSTVSQPEATVSTLRSFVVQNGVPGAQEG
jgi:alkaline phosphatase D